MSIPFSYKKIVSVCKETAKEYEVLEVDVLYGIKHNNRWVITAKVDMLTNSRTYVRPFLATKKATQNCCDKLNKLTPEDSNFIVVKI